MVENNLLRIVRGIEFRDPIKVLRRFYYVSESIKFIYYIGCTKFVKLGYNDSAISRANYYVALKFISEKSKSTIIFFSYTVLN